MKIAKKKLPVAVKAPEVEVLEPEVVDLDERISADPVKRIKYHLAKARGYAQGALRHIIEAGLDLMRQKQLIGYGGWNEWCEKRLSISKDTADRYIATYQRTVGAQRARENVALDAPLRKKELAAATVGMEEKTVRQAMLELGVIKRTKNKDGNSWGGKREGAGHPTKGAAEVAAELKAITQSESVIWSAAKGALDRLVQLDAERDMLHRLSDEHLAAVANLLADLADKSAKALAQRLEAPAIVKSEKCKV